ncbi:conserved protein of unknown function [Oenococcus oeni]|nr:conserved hypothetical protein [Oenococcus oeni]SYW05201.1 conserved hypothetical protein [Oenococcus oeni]SYW19317.1 conserved hypothetical protein [Oenococcus oeni]VDC15575.1 conserved protein of unknown function [Oenococcus oeni]
MDVNFSNAYSLRVLKYDKTNKETRKDHNIMINDFLATVGFLLSLLSFI